jgi:hypothetical protein
MAGNHFRVFDSSGSERLLNPATRMKWRTAIVAVTHKENRKRIVHCGDRQPKIREVAGSSKSDEWILNDVGASDGAHQTWHWVEEAHCSRMIIAPH